MKREIDSFYDDVLTTAVEGGINYWAQARNYRWSDDGPTTVDVRDGGFEDDEPGEWVALDRKAMSAAITAIREGKGSMADSYRSRILQAHRERDAGELDAFDADIVVQMAVLGDVIYG